MSRFKTPLQWLLIVLAGVASYVLAVKWRAGADADETVVQAVERSDRGQRRAGAATSLIDEVRDPSFAISDRSRGSSASDGDAFAVLSWLPPPPPPAPPAPRPPPPPPPAPVAPPLPYVFVRLMARGGPRPQAFMAKADALLIVGAGDVIDNNTYRVDSLSPQKIVITYLPLNTEQTLNIQGAIK